MFELIMPLLHPHTKHLEMLANGTKAAESLLFFKSKKTPPFWYTKSHPNCSEIQQELGHAEGIMKENDCTFDLQKGDFIHPSLQRVINCFQYFLKINSFKREKVDY